MPRAGRDALSAPCRDRPRPGRRWPDPGRDLHDRSRLPGEGIREGAPDHLATTTCWACSESRIRTSASGRLSRCPFFLSPDAHWTGLRRRPARGSRMSSPSYPCPGDGSTRLTMIRRKAARSRASGAGRQRAPRRVHRVPPPLVCRRAANGRPLPGLQAAAAPGRRAELSKRAARSGGGPYAARILLRLERGTLGPARLASAPADPISPHRARDTVVAALIGGLVGWLAVGAWPRRRWRRRAG